MKTAPILPRRSHRRFATAAFVAGTALALLLSGCTNTTAGPTSDKTSLSGGSSDITAASVDQARLADTIEKAFLTKIPVKDLDPVVADTLAVASVPLSAKNEALLKKCLSEPICDTGHGTLKVGIPIFVTANAYINVNRAEATAQLLAYPEVKQIQYSISNGDIAASIANVKSMITQGVNVIIVDLALGGAMNSVLKEAHDAGIIVVNVNTPPSADTLPFLDFNFPTGLCDTYKNGVKALTSKITTPSTYMLVTGIPGNDNAAAWQPCAKQAFDAAGWKQLPGAFTNWNSQGEAQAANALRASGQKPGAIVYDFSADKLVQPFIDAGEAPPAVISGVSTYSWLSTIQNAQKANVPIESWISNGHVWFSRLGVTAAIEHLHGKSIPKETTMNLPMSPTSEVMKSDWQSIPADSVISSLLTNEQISLALAAN